MATPASREQVELGRSITPPGRDGLTSEEAAAQLRLIGANELPQARPETVVKRLFRQLIEPMPVLLIIAAIVAWAGLGERLDGAAILGIVLANTLIALFQEGKTANALAALRHMETPTARVLRDGRVQVVPAREIVPGDIVHLAAGDRVPADIRLTDVSGLQIDESMLTGESLPVPKDLESTPGGSIADRSSYAFAGTLVFRGSGIGEVSSTAQRTQLGQIAAHLDGRQQPTPLQRELRTVSARLGTIAVFIAGAVFAVMLVRFGVGRRGVEMALLTSAALAVAAVPEGLPTVVTVGLALGVRRMAARGSIVRRLPAVETLGSTDVILTDKTGTLTENRMLLDAISLPDGELVSLDNIPLPIADQIIEALALCNDATLDPPTGDPLEIALLDAIGETRTYEIRRGHPRRDARAFDSMTRSMSTLNTTESGDVVLMKGAPEVVVALCTTSIASDGKAQPLHDEQRARLLVRATELAESGARVLALACKELRTHDGRLEGHETDLSFLGFVAMRDPVRPEARRAVRDALGAGIRILMVTGDHPGTAATIAEEVGLASGTILTGADIERDGLPADPTSVAVYARVDPEQKLLIVEALQKRGHVVAVTGDGVNDAPALRRADIGVAMGQAGSDVAREAAAMVVTDDNLATIVHAVREGRGIYDNIRKAVEYLVAGNLSEILVVVGGLLFFPHLGVPLLPLQLLWLNLLTDGFPALALGVDPIDPALMEHSPRDRSDHLLAGPRLNKLLVRGVLISSAAMGSLAFARFVFHQPWTHARSSMFSVLMTAHLLYAFAVRRSEGLPDHRNPWLNAAVGGGLVLQFSIVSIPSLQGIFSTVVLSWQEWALVIIAALLPITAIAMLSKGPRRAGTRPPDAGPPSSTRSARIRRHSKR